MTVIEPIRAGTEAWSGYDGLLRNGRRRVPVALRPVESTAPRGTTLIVQLHATRAGSQLWVEVTAYSDGVVVQASLDGNPMPERRFLAPRKREADLLAETIETAGRDPLACGCRMHWSASNEHEEPSRTVLCSEAHKSPDGSVPTHSRPRQSRPLAVAAASSVPSCWLVVSTDRCNKTAVPSSKG